MALLTEPVRTVRPAARSRATAWMPVAVLLLVAVLRLPSLSEGRYYGDEGVFAATAARLLDGETLYVEVWDNKPPLLFLTYAVALRAFGPEMLPLRLLGLLWAAGTALAVAGVGRRVGGGRGGAVAGVTFAVLAALPFTESTLLLSEALAALPVAVAVLLLLVGVGRPGREGRCWLLAAGVLLGCGALYKQVAVLDAAACGVWLVARGSGRRGIADGAILVAGWLAPVLAVALWLGGMGALGEAWRAVAGGYGGYLGEGTGLPAIVSILRFLPAALALAWLGAARGRGAVRPVHLVALWLGFALVGAMLSGRPYGHYLVQLSAPVAVAVGFVAGTAAAPLPRLALGFLLALSLWVVINGFSGFWLSHPSVRADAWGNWLAYAAGRRDRATYDAGFSWRIAEQDALARRIVADGGERSLFIWGEYPWLYAMLDAGNPTRYATAYQTVLVPGAKAEVIGDLRRRPPLYVVEEAGEWRRLPGLGAFLEEGYQPAGQVGSATLWRRR